MGLMKGPLTSPPRGSRLSEFATNFETCQIVLPLLDFLYSFDPTWCSLENCSIVWDNDEALRYTRDESFKLPLELVCFLRLFSGRSHVGGVPYGLVDNTLNIVHLLIVFLTIALNLVIHQLSITLSVVLEMHYLIMYMDNKLASKKSAWKVRWLVLLVSPFTLDDVCLLIFY